MTPMMVINPRLMNNGGAAIRLLRPARTARPTRGFNDPTQAFNQKQKQGHSELEPWPISAAPLPITTDTCKHAACCRDSLTLY